jgi:hypothetical protein
MFEITEEKLWMLDGYDTHYYYYSYRDCGYETKVEDMVIAFFPPSPRSNYRIPELQCFCDGDLCCVTEL